MEASTLGAETRKEDVTQFHSSYENNEKRYEHNHGQTPQKFMIVEFIAYTYR